MDELFAFDEEFEKYLPDDISVERDGYQGDAYLYVDKKGYLEKLKVSIYTTRWGDKYRAYVHGQKRELVVSLTEGEMMQGKVWFSQEFDDRAKELFIDYYKNKVWEADERLREYKIRLDRVKNLGFMDLENIPIPQRGVSRASSKRDDPFDDFD